MQQFVRQMRKPTISNGVNVCNLNIVGGAICSLCKLIRAAESRYQQHGVNQLTQQVQLLQSTLANTESVGERTVIATKLDNDQAQLRLWQAGAYQATHAWTSEISVNRQTKKTTFMLVFAALFSALLVSFVSAVVWRR